MIMNKPSILLIEDDEQVRKFLSDILKDEGYKVTESSEADDGVRLAVSQFYDLILVDVKLPKGRSGMEILRAAKAKNPSIAVVVITAYANVEMAVEAMNLGALDFIQKPSSWEELIIKVRKSLDHVDLSRRTLALEQESIRSGGSSQMVGDCPKMRELKKLIKRVASSGITVLIHGETGTGKELVARAIHELSPRKVKPFIAVDCNIPYNIVESELFGVIANYPGFHNKEPLVGKFEQSHGSTLFLDEVTELSQEVQTKLLRVLQEKVICPLGSKESRKVDVRIVSATNRDIDKMVSDGTFRQDLYYRLNVMKIDVPPIRERKEDIHALVEYFLHRAQRLTKRSVHKVSDEVVKLLEQYDYPGNIRELQNIIERAVLLTDGNTLLPSALPLELRESKAKKQLTGDLDMSKSLKELKKGQVDVLEKEYIIAVLKKTNGVISHAAKKAGIDRKNFTAKIRKYNINVDEFKIKYH